MMPTTEEEILKFWEEKKIYEKSKEKNKNGKKFYLMDGPPYASGNIHLGTALNKILKDIAMRSKRLMGYDVFDRAGYDTHGLPIENQVEKEIGTKTKEDIEKFGIKKFIERCREYATKYIGIMSEQFKNLGVWMDFDNPYLTLTDEYIESIWEIFKEAEKKGFVYLGKYPVHVCPRCETVVSFNEIEYKKQKDTSIFVKFKLKDKENTYLVIWTTTPWTLPGNTGVMVNPKFTYQEIELSNGERWIIAKELVPKIMGELEIGYNVVEEFSGKDMEGWKYENPLSKYLNVKTKNAYRVVLSERYVNLEEGTGLVHSAPGHGKEDYEVGVKNNLDVLAPVGIDGVLTEETGKYEGKKAREVDKEIIEDLRKDGALVYEKEYKHDYPTCWRCHTPLIMTSLPQWFLGISKIKNKLLEENEKNYWVPSWMKLRMKAWLEGLSDWPVSRKRYWGAPLPVWVCEKCEKRIVVESKKELEELSGQEIKEMHKPEIDDVNIKCECGGVMKRVPEVLDVWFDSGVTSWAALKNYREGYEENLKKFWPADLNIEGKDQVRGWWNSQLILSEIKFGRKPFEAILEHGLILDLGKKKMSKSEGNAITPDEVIEKYGRDKMRYFFARTSKGEDFKYDEREFSDVTRFFIVLQNLKRYLLSVKKEVTKEEIEDKWVISRLNNTIKEVTEKYDKYLFFEVVRILENFVINDFSKDYIKMIRERESEVYEVIREVYISILKMLAPIIPIETEKIWQELKENKIVEEESIHLSEWPELDEKKINKKLEEEFEEVFKIIEEGLRIRSENKIGLRWPLAKAEVTSSTELEEDFKRILKSQLNVKEVSLNKGDKLVVNLDLKMTPELEAEGYARELIRNIQAFRKELGLKKGEEVEIIIISDEDFIEIIKDHKELIKNKTNASVVTLSSEKKETFKNKKEFMIKDKEGEIIIIK